MTNTVPAIRNGILAGLPEPAYQRIADALEPVEVGQGQPLLVPGQPIRHCHFIAQGSVAVQYTLSDGHSAPVAIVGSEGAVGVTLVLGSEMFPVEAVTQTPVLAWRMGPARLRREFARGGALQRRLLRCLQALMTQMAQTAVCNHHHSLEMQLCRWVLLSLDRSDESCLRVTHDGISQLLGVRRAGITEAAIRLERGGLIEHGRGYLRVIDRPGLERHACQCYHVIRDEYERLRREADQAA